LTIKTVVDIETFAKEGKQPPKENVIYRFRVGKIHAEHDFPEITGREIMQKVGLEPTQNRLYQKVRGESKPIFEDDVVDLIQPGLERFETIPMDPTEGVFRL
jgi:hypothetical protein